MAQSETETAQRYLDAARASVDHALQSMRKLRDVRREEEGKGAAGRISDADMDLLRTAIVFAGAGLDATVKQLIRDALPSVARTSEEAESKFRDFVEQRIRRGGEGLDHRMLVGVLASDAQSPRDALLELYVEELTGGSLQSIDEVDRVCGALGITDADLRKRVKDRNGKLRELFVARNEIVHELDLQGPDDPGNRSRRERRIKHTEDLVNEALAVGQDIINAVGKELSSR